MTEIATIDAHFYNSYEFIHDGSLFKLLFCGLFKKPSFFRKNIDLELNSGLLSSDEIEKVIRKLPKDSYEVNCNQTIYALKKTGKPFFIDKSNYDFNIYLHQTNIQNSTQSDSENDFMYILLTLISQNIPQLNPQELENILKILPKVCYEVNCDQTIYSLKFNGKPFFIDKRFLNFEDYSQEINTESQRIENSYTISTESQRIENCYMISTESQRIKNSYMISTESQTLGEKFAEENRLVFMSFKGSEKDQRKRLIDELKKTGHKKEGKNWVSKNPLNPEIYLNRRKLIPQNGIYDDPKEVPPKEDKWDKSLVRRKLYTKSELMIRFFNMKETKFILNEC
jgi:hypothetical protein